ncbi:MAG: hypothetical protein WA789_10885 [Candidatus Acidiferrum sp.]
MPCLSPKERVSRCLFTFADGRRCRTPRSGIHPHFCLRHARKESQAQTPEKLGRQLHYFFSGDYVSACNLSTALGRILSAVARGDIKPKTAATLAYLAQTLHLSQHEHINAFGTDEGRKAVRDSVNQNSDYRDPPPSDEPAEAEAPAQPPAPPKVLTPLKATFTQLLILNNFQQY